ncbi:MAG: CheR family methyltransferase, partial [Casimicrobiaceae bacterium]
MDESDDAFDSNLEVLVEAIHTKYHYDFRHYSRVSLKRRLKSALSRLDYDSVAALSDRVLRDRAAFGKLLDFLTVHVSEMFRDPSYFRSMREAVIPVLRTYPSLKVWIAGCSTGEEAYSFAILLRE